MVRINGREVAVAGMTVKDCLEHLEYRMERVAVERNGKIVPRAEYEQTVLQDGDEVEVVSFVGGG